MTLRWTTKILLISALGLPVVMATLTWVAGLLTAMGDAAGAQILRHITTGCQVTWAVGLVGLVIVLGLVVVSEGNREKRINSQKPEEG